MSKDKSPGEIRHERFLATKRPAKLPHDLVRGGTDDKADKSGDAEPGDSPVRWRPGS